ncbi:MAG TPA: Gfo/Idh/MocA family oxidoreductase [Armatimonadota bacterium]|nr:Gfo/Idh/MocA family oxidoreductase [Armatimonadota bacterium]
MQRIGLMGCGTVAQYGHIPTLLATPGLTLSAIYDPSPEKLRIAQEQFHIPNVFTDVDEFFRSGIDAVSITSPAPCHLQNVIDASRYGKHILCEKPLAMTEEEITRMMAVTADAGVMLFTGFDYRFSPMSQKIHELIAQRVIGDVRSLRLIYIWDNHGKYTTINGQRVLSPRRVGRMEEGGPLVDCGVHQIDLARWWMGSEVVRWTAAGAWVDDFAAPDHIYLHMDHANGVHTMVEMSFSYCHTAAEPINVFTYELIGTDGLIRFDRTARVFEVRNSSGTQQLEVTHEKNFDGMYAAFADALEKGCSDMLPTAYDGLMATRIARTATEDVMAHRLQPQQV